MNQQVINKLAKRASRFSCTDKNEGRVYEAFVEKFAELIVKECAGIATMNSHQWEPPGYYVKKHFGVE